MHIGFGQNTVSSLYGHQKGDHMKTIGFSHKKHKANESQEKMTVTSGKDVCRKIGHSDEVDGENQENTYIHDSYALDASYANYIRDHLTDEGEEMARFYSLHFSPLWD